ncbi:unnamed protein product [Prunus armeniaca]|uniref:DUF4283 domain-containing protein n=1 Tax=Prunus armeniaca TaxID=36596 RepID=A0A6J5YAS8_PRUAR|nr:unnamed protein product [Prunus armeniaca]
MKSLYGQWLDSDHYNLVWSKSESVEVVGLEDLGNLKVERFLLVGRLLATKAIHKEALFGTLKRIWHTREEFTAVTLDNPKRFLFSFKSDFDRKKVMKGSPWTFDRALLLLTSTDGEVHPMSVSVDSQSFWVRVRRIPPIFLTPVMGEKLGNFLGTFYMVDRGLNGDCLGSFLRIRVGLKINEPLKRCVTLRLSTDEPAKQYEIEYERLPYFCLYCGRLDHVGSACSAKASGAVEVEQYGLWKTIIKDVYCIRVENQLKGKRLGLFDVKPHKEDAVSVPAKRTGMVRSLDEAFDGQEMYSGMDCPLAQVFKRRRVHKENEVTVLSQGADGEVVGNMEGWVHMNQGVSEVAMSDMGQLQLDGDSSQPPPTAPRHLDKGSSVEGR